MSREQLAELPHQESLGALASVGAAAGLPGGPLAVLAMAPDIFNLVLPFTRSRQANPTAAL